MEKKKWYVIIWEVIKSIFCFFSKVFKFVFTEPILAISCGSLSALVYFIKGYSLTNTNLSLVFLIIFVLTMIYFIKGRK